MARPRTITDERLLAALLETVGRLGPARLTLADVAAGAGVSTGALIQRYGTKRALLLAGSAAASAAFVDRLRAVFDRAPDPLTGLYDALAGPADHEPDRTTFAHHLAYLHLELADDGFAGPIGAFRTAVHTEILAYLRAAVAAGQLAAADPDLLAGAVHSMREGTQLTWAMAGPAAGPLGAAIRRNLDALLHPYRKA